VVAVARIVRFFPTSGSRDLVAKAERNAGWRKRMGEPARLQMNDEADDCHRSFASNLKQVRQRLAGKQAWLSQEVGCSDAAISFWESGGRLPNQQNLCRILAAVARAGATTLELMALRNAWHHEMARRSLSRIEQHMPPTPTR
jgi:DNA-binding transcriptional regulator YiaG